MSSEKAVAIVVRLADFSESSRVVTLFTREFGKISALAKGAKRLKSAFSNALDLLSICNVIFLRKSSGGLDLLTEAQLEQRFQMPGSELHRLYAGYYVAELLESFSEPYDPHPSLFDEARLILHLLSGSFSRSLALLRFEWTVLREVGQLPELQHCLQCDEAVADTSHSQYGFKVFQGGIVCPACQAGESAHFQISREALLVAQTLSDESAAWQNVTLSPEVSATLRGILNSLIAHHLGHRPKMFRYLQQG